MTNKSYTKSHNDGTYYYKDEARTILHREDGPAIEYGNGTKVWWLNGKQHREDGPAVEYYNGSKEWWLNGKYHREDGPAIEYKNGTKEWRLNGKQYSEADFNKEILKMKSKIYTKKYSYSTLYYKDEDCTILHRVDGPAVDNANGNKEWWLNGKLHRLDGPAIEWRNGSKEWWLNGKRHRLDGPAIENTDGYKDWYLNGKGYSEQEFNQETNKSNKPQNTTENIKMTTEKLSVTSMLKTSMIEGAKRNGVRTLTKASLVGVQTAIVKSAPAGPNTDAIIAFMATPAAEILIKGIVGFAIPHIPQLQDHKLAQLLGGECRNQTAEDAQREVFDKVMEFIVPAVMGSLAELQNSPQMRILLDETNKEEVSVPSQEEEVVSKKSSAAL